jgi:hypothetical protein
MLDGVVGLRRRRPGERRGQTDGDGRRRTRGAEGVSHGRGVHYWSGASHRPSEHVTPLQQSDAVVQI